MRIECTDDQDVLIDLAPEWDTWPGPMSSPFLRTEWFHAWASTRLAPADRLHVLVAWEGSVPVAALPLVKRGMRVRSLSDGTSDVFDAVRSPSADVVALMNRLGNEPRVLLDRVDSSSPLAAAVEDQPGWAVQRTLASPYVDLSGGPDQLADRLGKNLKKNLRRGRRKLEDMGELSIESSVTEDVPAVLTEAFELESRGWKGRAGKAVNDDGAKVDFFHSVAQVASEAGWLRLGVIRLDGRMVAFNYDLEYAGRMYGLLTSYDESLDPRSSLGSVLFWATLESAASRGVSSYEMGGDSSNEWKMMWTSTARPRVDITGFGSDLAGRAVRRAANTRRKVRALLR